MPTRVCQFKRTGQEKASDPAVVEKVPVPAAMRNASVPLAAAQAKQHCCCQRRVGFGRRRRGHPDEAPTARRRRASFRRRVPRRMSGRHLPPRTAGLAACLRAFVTKVLKLARQARPGSAAPHHKSHIHATRYDFPEVNPARHLIRSAPNGGGHYSYSDHQNTTMRLVRIRRPVKSNFNFPENVGCAIRLSITSRAFTKPAWRRSTAHPQRPSRMFGDICATHSMHHAEQAVLVTIKTALSSSGSVQRPSACIKPDRFHEGRQPQPFGPRPRNQARHCGSLPPAAHTPLPRMSRTTRIKLQFSLASTPVAQWRIFRLRNSALQDPRARRRQDEILRSSPLSVTGGRIPPQNSNCQFPHARSNAQMHGNADLAFEDVARWLKSASG